MLRRIYDDGRFFKTLQDVALAVILKTGHDMKFQFVVMNPPYIRIQLIPEAFRRRWERLYNWAEGNYDAFIPFIERAVKQWLEDEGGFGCIVSNRFSHATYAERFREYLPNEATLLTLVDFRAVPVFHRPQEKLESLAYAGILIANRAGMDDDQSFCVARVGGTSVGVLGDLMADLRVAINQVREGSQYARQGAVDAFPQVRRQLASADWRLMPDQERDVFDAIRAKATALLEDLTITHSGGFQGLVTGCDPVFVLRVLDRNDVSSNKKTMRVQPKGGGDPFEIERAIVRRWLFGRDIDRWHIAWDDWVVLFPYARAARSDDEGRYRYLLYPARQYGATDDQSHLPYIEDKFPLAWKYLKRTKIEQALRDREKGRFKRGKPDAHSWYGLARPQNMELYEEPKVLVQMLSRRPKVVLDLDGFTFQGGGKGGGIYGIAFEQQLDLWLLMGLLNSEVLDFYLKQISVMFQGGFYSYTDGFLKNLPLKVSGTRQDVIAKAIKELARGLADLKAELQNAVDMRSSFPGSVAGGLQADLFALEKIAVETHINAQTVNISTPSADPDLEGNWRVGLNDRSSVTMPTEAHADVVLAWLDLQGRSVDRDDVLALRLPGKAGDCQKILKKLQELELTIEEKERAIATRGTELNDRVASYYELTSDQQSVLRDFLARF
jgi:hypothetical protein